MKGVAAVTPFLLLSVKITHIEFQSSFHKYLCADMEKNQAISEKK
jgi:hypothetical protein